MSVFYLALLGGFTGYNLGALLLVLFMNRRRIKGFFKRLKRDYRIIFCLFGRHLMELQIVEVQVIPGEGRLPDDFRKKGKMKKCKVKGCHHMDKQSLEFDQGLRSVQDKLSKDEFYSRMQIESGYTREFIDEKFNVIVCPCGKVECCGWTVEHKESV